MPNQPGNPSRRGRPRTGWWRSARLAAPALGLLLGLAACSSSVAALRRPATTTVAGPVDVAPSAGCDTSAVATASGAPGAPAGAGRSGARTITVDGRQRTYLIEVPPTGSGPFPLVLLFHGFGSSASSIAALTAMPDRAAAKGMVTVVPDGTATTWTPSDPAFVDALTARVEAEQCIDLHRVFTTGFSAGAAFAISYACTHPDRVAAVAPVAVDLVLGCSRPTSIMAFHGTLDPMVPYAAGGEGLSLPGVKVPGTEADMARWAELGRCDPRPASQPVSAAVTRRSWSGCARGAEVVLYRIDGGGHSWPGATRAQPDAPGSGGVSATDEILAFFARHHLVA